LGSSFSNRSADAIEDRTADFVAATVDMVGLVEHAIAAEFVAAVRRRA
jgi:hypothetical protein